MLLLDSSEESWEVARRAISAGRLVVFPTDTVYGVACDPRNVKAIELLYQAKARDKLKAIPLLLSGADRLPSFSGRFPRAAEVLATRFWPGALTLVVPRAAGLSSELGGGDTIAVRVPDHVRLRDFIAACGGALATTSANMSGQPDARTAGEAAEYLGAAVDVIIDGGTTRGGVPSTVVNCAFEVPTILRAGAITEQEIRGALSGGEASRAPD